MDPNSLKDNPHVFDKLKPELGGKIVKAVADDMARAKREAEEKEKAKRERQDGEKGKR